MILFSVITIVVGLLLATLATLLCIGKTFLINDYHRDNVPAEKMKIFGISLGFPLYFMSLGFLVGGILGLTAGLVIPQYAYFLIIFIPVVISIIAMFIIIKKFNGWIIS